MYVDAWCAAWGGPPDFAKENWEPGLRPTALQYAFVRLHTRVVWNCLQSRVMHARRARIHALACFCSVQCMRMRMQLFV